MDRVVALPGRQALRSFVRTTLCQRDQLEPDSTTFFEAIIFRSGRICGLYFEIQGPRLLRTCAVWAGEEHRILFYDSTGERFAEIHLSDEPDPKRLADDSTEPQAA